MKKLFVSLEEISDDNLNEDEFAHILNMGESSSNLEDLTDGITTAVEGFADLLNLNNHVFTKDMSSPATEAATYIAIESVYNRLGLNTDNVVISQEGLIDNIKRIWNACHNGVLRLQEELNVVTYTFYNYTGSLKRSLLEYRQQLDIYKDPKTEVDNLYPRRAFRGVSPNASGVMKIFDAVSSIIYMSDNFYKNMEKISDIFDEMSKTATNDATAYIEAVNKYLFDTFDKAKCLKKENDYRYTSIPLTNGAQFIFNVFPEKARCKIDLGRVDGLSTADGIKTPSKDELKKLIDRALGFIEEFKDYKLFSLGLSKSGFFNYFSAYGVAGWKALKPWVLMSIWHMQQLIALFADMCYAQSMAILRSTDVYIKRSFALSKKFI